MDLSPPRFDLNLVRAFVAIYETKSVTQAAERLNLTQPTISHALSKLRDLYGDRLFSRGSQGLVPTAIAERVYEQLSGALTAIEGTVDARSGFEPRTSTRRFRIALSDIGSLFFTPPLLRRFQQLAPRIQIEFVQLSDTLLDDLARGTLDLAIGTLPMLHSHTRNELVFRESYACLVACEHPAAAQGIDLERFSHARHVMVTSPSSGHALVDGVLAERGVQRNVVALVPEFSVLPSLIEDSDLVVVLPKRVAQLFERQRRVKALDLPVDIPAFDVRLHWHMRQEGSPAHTWLRTEVTKALEGL